MRSVTKLSPVYGLALAGLALAAPGCEDGSHILSSELEPAPIIPKQPQAATTPVAAFSAEGTSFPLPPGGYGAAGPRGLWIVRTDLGEVSARTSLEEADAVVCDPSNGRVLLLKSRAHQSLGNDPVALTLATSVSGSLDGAAAVVVVEPTTNSRRLLVATSAGYTVLREDGSLVAAHQIQGAPFTEISISRQQPALFLASGAVIRRVVVDAQNELQPVDQSVTPNPSTVIHTAAAPLTALFPGNNDDLLFGEANLLRRLPDASSPFAGQVTLTTFTFAAGEVVEAVIVNSAGNAVVALDASVPTPIEPGRLVEVSLSEVNQTPGSELSVLQLGEPPRDLAIDGAHGVFVFSSAGDVGVRLEPAPDLDERLMPILNTRACVGCHPVISNIVDFSTGDTTFATLVSQPISAGCAADDNTPGIPATPSPLRVAPGDSGASLLIEKLLGLRDGSPQALNGFATCGVRMPFGLRPVPEVEIDSFRRWIDAGATR